MSRDVTFNESSNNNNKKINTTVVTTSADVIADSVVKDEPTAAPNANHNTTNSDVEPPNVQPAVSASADDDMRSATGPPSASVPAPAPRRSERITRKPGSWWIAKPSSYSNSSPTLDVSLLVTCCDSPYEVALLAPEVPNTYDEAMSPEPGIKKEEDSIRENITFELVERKPHMNVIPCRYVFRVKKDVGPKVRIVVAKGFRHVPGVGYNETYAPVVSMSIVRLFLCLVNLLDLECDQMDVVTAFLNGDLDEEIFMEVPAAGFHDPNRPNLVWRLLKALYGLKQAPRQWYAKIHRSPKSTFTNALNFISSAYEPCLYVFYDGHLLLLLIIILYVDDLLIAGNSRKEICRVKGEVMKVFKMKDLGEVKEFLGIEIIRNRVSRTLRLTQSTYVAKVLERFEMSDSNPSATPMMQSSKVTPEDSKALSADVPYRSAIGSLIYVMICTRPDLGFAVGRLLQYCEEPLRCHWNAVKRVYRHVKGTQDTGIVYDAKAETSPDAPIVG